MNKKKLILFMPTIDIGGVEKNFVIISNFLSTKIKNISIVSTSYNKRKQFSKKINFITIKNQLINKLSRRLKFLIGIYLLTKELLKNKNSIVFSFQANVYCIYLCKLLNKKIIVRSNSSPTGWSKGYFKNLIYKNALQISDKVIVNSNEFKKIVRKKFDVNSTCIYNPLNQKEIIKKSKKKILFKFFRKNTFNFINVARFEHQKDHLTLLKGFLKLKKKLNFRLLLIGSGRNERLIKEFIKKNKLQNDIRVMKNIINPFPYIKKSNFFILSSAYEGLPNVLLEAMILKKYIISSDCPTGPKEILNYGKGGSLFKTGDPDDLKKKINEIYTNKKLIEKKVNYSQKNLSRFDSLTNLTKYLNTVRSHLIN